MTGFVRVEREGACAWVTLDRPPLNLIVPEMVEGIRSAFETLRRVAGVKDPAVMPIAQIVHEIDLKDGKFGRPETRGIERILAGILNTSSRDEERLERGFALFDQLYESFRRKPKEATT